MTCSSSEIFARAACWQLCGPSLSTLEPPFTLLLLQRAQPAIGVADADQGTAEPEERERSQHTAECCHVGEEDLGDDEADAGQRRTAQPIAAPSEPGGEPGSGKSEPAGGV